VLRGWMWQWHCRKHEFGLGSYVSPFPTLYSPRPGSGAAGQWGSDLQPAKHFGPRTPREKSKSPERLFFAGILKLFLDHRFSSTPCCKAPIRAYFNLECYAYLLYPHVIRFIYSGFHLAPQLASRAAGAPPARGTRGAVGGTGHIVTRNRQGPFSEFSNFDYLQS
jgi:hypothetical protein